MATLFSEDVSGTQIPMVEADSSVLPPFGQYDAIRQQEEALSSGLLPTPYLQQPFVYQPMMANQPSSIVGGMFSPEISRAAEMEFMQKRQAAMQNEALAYAQLSPMQQAQFGFYRGGQQLGDALGGALGGQDPQLKLISQRQRLLSQLDRSDPESYKKIALQAQQTGDSELATLVSEAGRKLELDTSLIKQRGREAKGADPFQQIIRSGKYTPTSLSKYQQSGNVADLELIEKVKDDVVVVGNALVSKTTGLPIYQGENAQKYSSFAQKLIEAGLTPNTEPFQRRMLEHINAETKGAEKGTGNVTIGGITIDTGAASKAAGKIVGENVANIENQYSLLTGVSDALKLIDKGIYAGAYGPEKGFIAKYSGGVIGDSKKVQNTEVFMSNIGEIVIPRLIQFGGNDSNEELKYLQKVVAGDQRIEPESMKRILASAEKKIRNNIARLQKQVEAGGTGSQLPIEPIETPSAIPKPTKRYNPQTKKLEVVTGE